MTLPDAPDPHTLLRDHTVYSCVLGSRAFGLATADSDTDRRGVFLVPTRLFWRFDEPTTHVDGPAVEQFSTPLPAEPDTARVEGLLHDVRRASAQRS